MAIFDTLTARWRRIKRIGRPRQTLNFIPQPHYYYLVSFPKSGSTWVRFLLANIISGEDLALRGFGRYVPDSHIKGDIVAMNDLQSPFNQAQRQFVKTHFRYQPQLSNVIYIVRDGRDAITSYYHWYNSRNEQQVSLQQVIAGETYWGRWSDHVMGWLKGRCKKRLLVRYEDLYADTAGELRRILAFAEITATADQIVRAVEASSFESMRKKEENLLAREVSGTEAPKEVKANQSFMRKGGTGNWRDLFTPADEDLFWKYHAAGMTAVGYEK